MYLHSCTHRKPYAPVIENIALILHELRKQLQIRLLDCRGFSAISSLAAEVSNFI